MFHGKASRNGCGHQIEIQFEGINLLKRNFPFFCKGLENDLFINYPGDGAGTFQVQRSNYIDDAYRTYVPIPGSILPVPFFLRISFA
jgi:hypothetical protein